MTTVEISIAGRGEADAPLLGDLIDQIQDFFAMLYGVAETLTGEVVQQFDWRVVALSKNSPARIIVEAVPLPGHADGAEIAARARDLTTGGLRQLAAGQGRPIYFNDNVIDAADRFLSRNTKGLSETIVGSAEDPDSRVTISTPVAIATLQHLAVLREA
ncbi:hypothetical protein, partial [Sphingomonas sp.]|uniref:hypothetical protein n=1 Tax=Sphingomonas sp. TaxID=28214 RepID=UPI002DB5B10D